MKPITPGLVACRGREEKYYLPPSRKTAAPNPSPHEKGLFAPKFFFCSTTRGQKDKKEYGTKWRDESFHMIGSNAETKQTWSMLKEVGKSRE